MTTRPYELLARFSPDGTIAGVSVRTITTVNGRDYESDPAPLSGATDPALTAFASQFAAASIAERDTALSERDAALQQVESVRAELQMEIDRLTALIPTPVDPNAVPEVITRTQARLVLHRAGLLPQVLQIIEAGGVEAQIWYEANEWHRSSPVLAGMAQALGFTDEQVDNLFRAAGAIVL
jgi:hypothetical protein